MTVEHQIGIFLNNNYIMNKKLIVFSLILNPKNPSNCKYNGFYLAVFEWVLSLNDAGYDAYIYNYVSPQTKLDLSWIDFKYNVPQLNDINFFNNYKHEKYLFVNTASLYLNTFKSVVNNEQLKPYIIIHDHDDILRDTPHGIEMRKYVLQYLKNAHNNFIVTTSTQLIPLYNKIGFLNVKYLIFNFYYAHKLKHDTNINDNICYQSTSKNKLKYFYDNTGTYKHVLQTLMKSKYFLFSDSFNKFDKSLNVSGEGCGRQLIEAVICDSAVLSIPTYLYTFLLNDVNFVNSNKINYNYIKQKFINNYDDIIKCNENIKNIYNINEFMKQFNSLINSIHV